MGYTASADTVVFRSTPQSSPAGSPVPPCLSAHGPDCWPPGNVVFAGPLRNPRGRRLVVVQLSHHFFICPEAQQDLAVPLKLDAWTIVPAGLKGRPFVAWSGSLVPLNCRIEAANPLNELPAAASETVFAGHVDPGRPADFVAASRSMGGPDFDADTCPTTTM